MAAVLQTIACLRFFGDDLDPDQISKVLGVAATNAYRKGDVMPSGKGKKSVAETGTWQLEADEEFSGELPEQIASLFAALTDDLTVWKDLSARFDGDVLMGLFMAEANEGFSLDPALLGAIAARGLVLEFDVYASEEDDAYYEDDAVTS
ncbi:DUF4279 domain-containing protein [Rhizobiales bacterium RZME27]|uniref:DUF4279 domain-containing protein n=1 Tax=Endobacterium cereale TaxID=2663029 RepID=A0A6A8AEM6_9HYPH|nr:DUF4279 domain-containing protein [Endobacterium cereale]MEB2843242.1 DUF4279 domain-containing protein [Endobacterium cereale]MQY47201.1 DUF4279 domain-containing protein [Endobacterium cereale]